MINESEREIAELFETQVMPKIVRVLESVSAELAKRPIEDFKKVIDLCVRTALTDLLKMAGLQKVENLSPYLSAMAAAEIVGGLNSALPLDYPYIVCVLRIEDEKGTLFMCMRRNKIPGMHDLLTKDIVPICKVSTRAGLFAPDLKFNVHFLDSENPAG